MSHQASLHDDDLTPPDGAIPRDMQYTIGQVMGAIQDCRADVHMLKREVRQLGRELEDERAAKQDDSKALRDMVRSWGLRGSGVIVIAEILSELIRALGH